MQGMRVARSTLSATANAQSDHAKKRLVSEKYTCAQSINYKLISVLCVFELHFENLWYTYVCVVQYMVSFSQRILIA